MRYLPISIFILTLILSCSLPLTKGLLEITPENKHVVNRYFSNTKMDYIYKTKFQILEHTFGGILIVKKIGEDYHRVVLTTEFGNKIFDFDFKENDFKVNYILDDLNKNFINNLLL